MWDTTRASTLCRTSNSRRFFCRDRKSMMMIVNAPKQCGLPKKPALPEICFDPLGLDDFWCYEEDQFIGLCLDQALLEQIAKPRNIAQKRRLCSTYRVGGLDHSADHDRAAIGHQYLGCSLLGRQDVVSIDGAAGLSIFNIDGEKDCAVRSNLRSDRKPQNRVDVGNAGIGILSGRGVNRDLDALFHFSLHIALGDNPRT